MWNEKKSAVLSLAVTYCCAVLLIAVMFIAPSFVTNWYGGYRPLCKILLTVFYCCCPLGFATLFCLRKLLSNIHKEQTFIVQNTTLLRVISWCCFAVSVITLAGGFYYLPFLLVSAGAGFLALILRVVKNVMSSAIRIKDENELTI